ncbi:MAG: serine/threonine-protein kinase [Fimbriimonadales bacterium]
MPASPLAPGTVLGERFEVVSVLGTGGFSLAYRATDRLRGDDCVVKELAPPGSTRNPDGSLEFGELSQDEASLLCGRFLDEARRLGRLTGSGLLPIRDCFLANRTAYYVTDSLPGATTLEQILASKVQLEPDAALDILYAAMEALESVHRHGVLHRDLKPSNILVAPDGRVVLIDFGAAREWHADAAVRHTILFTPGYAPIEQLAERGRRGPATDIYALCATTYHMLTGAPPPSATERASGVRLVPLLPQVRGLELRVAEAIEAGLATSFRDRPQSVAALRERLALPEEEPARDLAWFDDMALRLQAFRPKARACPACGGLLENPRPLRAHMCPVCREGRIAKRSIPSRLCPCCRQGALRSPGILKRGQKRLECDVCHAVFEIEADGRWRRMEGVSEYDALWPEEWERVAAGLDPGAGNSVCSRCQADYFIEKDAVTLLGATEDPYGFAARWLGRLMEPHQVKVAGGGKPSGMPGLICADCGTEFDSLDGAFALVETSSPRLKLHLAECLSIADWQRRAKGLPTAAEEPLFEEEFDAALRDEYRTGKLDLDASGTRWKGRAVQIDRGAVSAPGTLVATADSVRFGGLLRRQRVRQDEIVAVHTDGQRLSLELENGDVWVFRPEPLELSIKLRSGTRRITLGPADLAVRLSPRAGVSAERSEVSSPP